MTPVFPAQAGVFLKSFTNSRDTSCLPRASGGVSSILDSGFCAPSSSPRKRGCFRRPVMQQWADVVFPAQAGVFPCHLLRIHCAPSLPRASGGVSCTAQTWSLSPTSSPRKRGCFRGRPLPTGLPFSLPRASGGVSVTGVVLTAASKSSPRKRGCFCSVG